MSIFVETLKEKTMNKNEFLAMSIFTGLKYLDDNKKMVDLHCIDNGIGLVNFGWGDAKNIDEVFPILHPLSDLTKEIEHKGEKFVPLEEFGLVANEQNLKHIISMIRNEFITIKESVMLIKWHFDFADLISKGEAIDVNTLPENPYK